MIRFAIVTAVLFSAAPALAQEAPTEESGYSWEAEVGVVSDYRYRGVSNSGERPAVQGGATLYAPDGWYAGVWSSSIEEYGVGSDGDGARAELDFSFGRGFQVHGFDVDMGVAAYTYPDGDDVSYVEFPLSVSRTMGAWTVTGAVAYAPAQTGTGDEADTYVSGAVEYAWPEKPFALTASVGLEEGAWYHSKVDWSAGARFDLGKTTLSLLYVDTDDRSARATLVAGIGLKFGG